MTFGLRHSDGLRPFSRLTYDDRAEFYLLRSRRALRGGHPIEAVRLLRTSNSFERLAEREALWARIAE